jgi:hypothetical protein
MSKRRVLSLKPHLRLERGGQDGQNETEQPNHSASLDDSITSSTRIGFLVQTVANGVPGFSRNVIRLDRRARAVKRQHAADDGVRGFMTGGMSAALGHWYPAKSEKLTQAKGQVHAGQSGGDARGSMPPCSGRADGRVGRRRPLHRMTTFGVLRGDFVARYVRSGP